MVWHSWGVLGNKDGARMGLCKPRGHLTNMGNVPSVSPPSLQVPVSPHSLPLHLAGVSKGLWSHQSLLKEL